MKETLIEFRQALSNKNLSLARDLISKYREEDRYDLCLALFKSSMRAGNFYFMSEASVSFGIKLTKENVIFCLCRAFKNKDIYNVFKCLTYLGENLTPFYWRNLLRETEYIHLLLPKSGRDLFTLTTKLSRKESWEDEFSLLVLESVLNGHQKNLLF